ncbi:hypothetical protein [Petroclostridium sp. X23]|uniref:hypothetical protein n=1 Tax=Petroclostridium sp. X23 TaxID=3045146 RepID=UPI0024AE181E|nr:hypothetical protein [Petroclostridium sp. X23]WHH59659.1 hypothetical protein QKW49_02540 [Petroclostridium sp. X23]
MSLSDKDKKLLVLLGLIGVLAITYFYVYTPFVKKLNTLKDEVLKLETNYNTLQGKSAQKSKVEAQMKILRYEMDKLSSLLPPDIYQDKAIIIIKELGDITGVKLKDLSFSEVASMTSESTQKKTEPTLQQKILEEVLPSDDAQKDEKKTEEEGKIPNNTGITMEVKTNYTASYDQMKDFLAKVMDFEQKVIVSDITFSKDLQDTLSGSLKLTFYGFKDSTRKVPGWESDVKQGKDNIFEPFEGYIELRQNTGVVLAGQDDQEESEKESKSIETVHDFYISLGPSNHDVPTVIMYKSGKINSTVYGDGNGVEKVEFHIDYKDGKYLYRYKTTYGAYPKDESKYQEFVPQNEDYMILKISSKDRLDDKDLAGANIDIYNNAPIKLIVQQKDDSQRPRAKISVKNGDVGIVNE